jgi:hypothetical protein
MMVKGKQTEDLFMDASDEALNGVDPIMNNLKDILM